MKRGFLSLLAVLAPAWAQLPAINPGGVVNAASYTTGIAELSGSYPRTGGGPALTSGSLASIFGANLAAVTLSGEAPFPRQLGGTSVSVDGIAAPLLFVSPNQINFQIPSPNDTTPGASSAQGIVVATAAGQSAPYQISAGGEIAPGIFTRNGSGCGEGAVLNVAADGSVSVNSATNSAAPGQFISIYGTGNGYVYNSPPDGVPAPTQPLASSSGGWGQLFDFSAGGAEGPTFGAGRAPGLVGVDQFNLLVPATARQGCAAPLQIFGDDISPPVTISIANGGGPCSDPPERGYGEVAWEKTTTTAADYSVITAETVTVSLQESPGRQAPTPDTYSEAGTLPGSGTLPGYTTYYGPACPIPGYRSLDAGAVTARGPGMTATTAQIAPLSGGTVIQILPRGGFTPTSQVQSSQAAGLSVYQAPLPSGTIQPGAFTVAAAGGADVGAFQSTVQIGSPIQIVTALAARVLDGSGPPLTIQWTGGDANSWVVVKLVGNIGPREIVPWAWTARATDGQITIQGSGNFIGFGIGGPVEIVIDVVPDPSQIPPVTATGLSLGGRARWKYSYRFEGVLAK